MNEKYDLYDIGNFIINLYDKTGGKYFCNHLKLNKLVLLSLYNYFLKTNEIFIKDIKVYCDTIYGLKIDTSDTFFRSPITISNVTCNDSIKDISKKDLETYCKSKIFRFDEREILSNELVSNTLIDTFVGYASYDTIELNNILNTYVNDSFIEAISKYNKYATTNLAEQYKGYLLIRQIESRASYLASLFYKSGCIYRANRTKIMNLLTINLLCDTENPELSKALCIGDDRVGIPLKYYFDVIMRDLYLNLQYKDDNKEYTNDFDEAVKVPNVYLQRMKFCPLDNVTKNRLEDIFRNFASYKSYEVSKMLNDMIPLIKKDKIHIGYNSKIKYQDNKVFNYISSYTEKSENKILIKTMN